MSTPAAPRVLIAEPSRTLATLIRASLSGLPLELEVVYDGVEALQAAQLRAPALLVTDVALSGLDGYALAHTLKQHAPPGEPLPVLLLVPEAHRPDPERLAYVGIRDVLIKPFERATLRERVRALLELDAPPASRSDTQLSFTNRVVPASSHGVAPLDAFTSITSTRSAPVRSERFVSPQPSGSSGPEVPQAPWPYGSPQQGSTQQAPTSPGSRTAHQVFTPGPAPGGFSPVPGPAPGGFPPAPGSAPGGFSPAPGPATAYPASTRSQDATSFEYAVNQQYIRPDALHHMFTNAPTSLMPPPGPDPAAIAQAVDQLLAPRLPTLIDQALGARLPALVDAAVDRLVRADLPTLIDQALDRALSTAFPPDHLTSLVRAAIPAAVAGTADGLAHRVEGELLSRLDTFARGELREHLVTHAEHVVWKVVPKLAEELVRAEIERLTSE